MNHRASTHNERASARRQIAHGFTLIELLVVVAIIVSLIAILLPSLNKAVSTANRAVCGSQLKQIMAGSIAYAADSHGAFPHRGSVVGASLTHSMFYSTDYDLNVSFFPRYLDVPLNTAGTARQNDDILFCPGDILSIRYPGLTPFYDYKHITYQYFVMPTGDGRWLHENSSGTFQPDLRRLANIPPGRWPIWADLMLARSDAPVTGWLGHDSLDTPETPAGMNAAIHDGSVAWTDFDGLEKAMRWTTGSPMSWYWPRPFD